MEVYQDWLRRTLILLNLAFPEIRESLICLPIYPALSDEDVDRIINMIKR